MITVWYQPHDDPDVGYIVNDINDMQDNWEDLVDQGIAQGSFADYLNSWPSMRIPADLWESGNDDLIQILASIAGLESSHLVELYVADDESDDADPSCNGDCDPGGNSEDYARHATHHACTTCPYHSTRELA